MWLFLGLVSAFSDASKNVLAKHNTKSFNSIVVTWAWVTYSLILLIPLMFIKGIPTLDTVFWVAFTARIILDLISLLMYVEAIKLSDLSMTLPMLALTPLFLLVSGLLINGEFPSSLGLVGVLLIVMGTYLLNFKRNQTHFLEPFMCLYQDRGTLMMFGTAAIWGLTGSLHKLAILHSNAYFYTGFGAVVLSLILTPMAWYTSQADFKKSISRKYLPQLVPVGLLDGLTVLSQMVGQSISLTVLVISLKRTSIIFSSLISWYVFKEDIKKRLAPMCLMVLGVILIAVS